MRTLLRFTRKEPNNPSSLGQRNLSTHALERGGNKNSQPHWKNIRRLVDGQSKREEKKKKREEEATRTRNRERRQAMASETRRRRCFPTATELQQTAQKKQTLLVFGHFPKKNLEKLDGRKKNRKRSLFPFFSFLETAQGIYVWVQKHAETTVDMDDVSIRMI